MKNNAAKPANVRTTRMTPKGGEGVTLKTTNAQKIQYFKNLLLAKQKTEEKVQEKMEID